MTGLMSLEEMNFQGSMPSFLAFPIDWDFKRGETSHPLPKPTRSGRKEGTWTSGCKEKWHTALHLCSWLEGSFTFLFPPPYILYLSSSIWHTTGYSNSLFLMINTVPPCQKCERAHLSISYVAPASISLDGHCFPKSSIPPHEILHLRQYPLQSEKQVQASQLFFSHPERPLYSHRNNTWWFQPVPKFLHPNPSGILQEVRKQGRTGCSETDKKNEELYQKGNENQYRTRAL